jgi:mutator protein MutT
VFRHGKVLITQRPLGGHLEGLWEFPGGKLEPGETAAACLVRELQEELGVEVEVGVRIETLSHTYPEKTVRLHFFSCRLLRGEPAALGCSAFHWAGPEELKAHAFPAADARLLERLQNDPGLWRE